MNVGGSHGIGHQLGPYGVPHAGVSPLRQVQVTFSNFPETTCVCLPAVQKFNAKVNSTQQKELLDVLWGEPDIAAVLTKYALVEDKADLGDALDAIIRELGFPRSLKAYGVGRDKLDAIAQSSLGDVCSKWNAIPLVEKGQVMEILEMCLEDEREGKVF
jgi:alcohol dehydrogenase class IV